MSRGRARVGERGVGKGCGEGEVGAGGGVGSRCACTRCDTGEDVELLTNVQEEGVP